MKTHNPDNERIKRQYFQYLKEAKRYSEASLDAAAAAIHGFEARTQFRSFKSFHIQQAIAYKRHLAGPSASESGKPLSKATLYSRLNALRTFFQWLAGQPGFKSRISYSDAEYFNLSEKETRVAKARRERPVPSLEQVRSVIFGMPSATVIERRDRALIAFTLLTGARDQAIASLKLKHVNLQQRQVFQDAREVKTKFSKSFQTWFFPVGIDVERIVVDWIELLRSELLYGPDAPLFPTTEVSIGPNHQFTSTGITQNHWSSTGPIRRIFKEAFEVSGLPYFNPHSFRNTLVQLGERLCRSPEEFKAWSQNIGHEKVMTTFTSYGSVATSRQAEIIRNLHTRDESTFYEDRILAQIRELVVENR